MSEINKLDNKQCSFDPDQYKKKIDVDDVAPIGSFPWAIIKLYLGQKVRRNSWASPYEHIKLTPSSTGSDGKNIPPQIWVIDKDDEQIWVPEQEDMMACDWELAQMLSFDLKVGTGTNKYNNFQSWGYENIGTDESPFGTLTNLQSTLGLGNIISEFLVAEEEPIGTFSYISLILRDLKILPNPQSNFLEVAVNGSIYNLGSSRTGNYDDGQYTSRDAKALGEVLKQNVGNTLHFFFQWK
ncbi:Thoeris anti-defense Tad2 family protein [Xenorhabdus doucetiae]|uniref:Uncharacterized protein DUF2829 n=1 Tax=Xenorhabdus doucetiae TaxID=351671 RepID=A0A068QWU0_9GAMM|nr:MW1434 family type I TA system toxin [Xenorhabdus doucetiae]TYO98191.1 uncharacterized protein DUF2829 [Xenorhabdus doucetiae]CDG19502.1 conserved protein of unknown function [Xenorhabdus doucetiae]